jgi:DNA-binding HxlR family transcriptional regulator
MSKKIIEKRFGCVAFAAKILGDKWTPLLIQNLYQEDGRFSSIQQTVKINPRTLSSRLDFLESVGIVARTVHTDSPPRVEYTLTNKGKDLIPILKKMAEWGDRYNPGE